MSTTHALGALWVVMQSGNLALDVPAYLLP